MAVSVLHQTSGSHWAKHPYNTAAKHYGRRLNSYRSELHAVRLLFCGVREWRGTKVWITLDNETVMGEISRLMKGKLGKKVDNVCIWNAQGSQLQRKQRRVNSKRLGRKNAQNRRTLQQAGQS